MLLILGGSAGRLTIPLLTLGGERRGRQTADTVRGTLWAPFSVPQNYNMSWYLQ